MGFPCRVGETHSSGSGRPLRLWARCRLRALLGLAVFALGAAGLSACTVAVEAVCEAKSCADLGKACGSWADGCGGTLDCGGCVGAASCDEDGACHAECVPDCGGSCCGSDGCGGECPDPCGDTGQVCDEDSCTCTGACTPLSCATLGKQCGSWADGCGGTLDCGGCSGPASCDEDGACQAPCVPECTGSCCGSDGCGGECPDRCGDTQQVCDEDSCACVGACTPTSCTELVKDCGSWPDGCGGTVDCGGCSGSASCDANGACREPCVPDCTGRCAGADGCGGVCPDSCSGSDGFCDTDTGTCESVCGYQLKPTTPFRRLDTRSEVKLQGGSVQTFALAGRDGIPADAQAVVLRFTVVAPEAAGFLTAYDAGAATPEASVLNYAAAQTVGDTVWVKLGAQNKIAVFSSATTHLIIDVFGYTAGSEAFHAQTPHRLIDTRGGATPEAGSSTCMTVAGVGGVAADAKAVAVVLTAVQPEAAGSMVAYASGAAVPPTRSQSYSAGQVAANGSIVAVGGDGKICVKTTARSNFILDVNGFFEANAAYRPLAPHRALDVTPGSGSTSCHRLAGVDGIPADAQAIALNLTALGPAAAGFASVYAKGTQLPVASNLNYAAGGSTTNGVISKVGDNGEVCFYLLSASRLLVDVVGYWPGADSCCASQTCQSPPVTGCTGTAQLIRYASSGTCSRGSCDYGHAVTGCGYLCQQNACIPPPTPSYPYHDRTEWQDPARPVSSTSLMSLGALRYITIHYAGVDGLNLSSIPQVLRNAQLDYTSNRGYSLGYNSAISPDGAEWEIRGFDYRCAANGEQATNIPSYAIQMLLPNTWSVPSQSQIDGVRQLVAKIRATAAAAGNSDFLEINGHRDLKATACPGDVIYNMIQNGSFEP
ncbi:MAG: N-acetylmuramoyl-L-alanine amidase [Pseudomonadota bacterium]